VLEFRPYYEVVNGYMVWYDLVVSCSTIRHVTKVCNSFSSTCPLLVNYIPSITTGGAQGVPVTTGNSDAVYKWT
jgi:hypothetical protein